MNRIHRLLVVSLIFCFSSLLSAQVIGPPSTIPNDLVTWANNNGTLVADPGSFQIVGPSGAMTTMQANMDTQSLVIQGGQDTSTPDAVGGITIKGATVLYNTIGGGTGGTVTVQGGDNSTSVGTGGATAGSLILRPGAAAGSANAVPGRLVISQTFRSDTSTGATYTCPDPNPLSGGGCRLACVSGHNTVSDCTSLPSNNYVGVELPPIVFHVNADGSKVTGANVAVQGIANVESATQGGTWTQGDIVCVDPNNAAFVVDNHTNLCTTTKQVGIVTLGGTIGMYTHTIILAR